MRTRLIRLVLAGVAAGSTLLMAAPVSAAENYVSGPYVSEAECDESAQVYRENGSWAGGCYYRDLPNSWQDGWYFRHGVLP